jgi:hypothetical protein
MKEENVKGTRGMFIPKNRYGAKTDKNDQEIRKQK